MRIDLQTNELPVADVDEALAEVDPSLLDLLPPEVCLRFRIVPLARKGNALVIGFYDKLTSLAAYEIQLLTGLRVVSVRLREGGGVGMPSLGASPEPTLPRNCAVSNLLGRRKRPRPLTRPCLLVD